MSLSSQEKESSDSQLPLRETFFADRPLQELADSLQGNDLSSPWTLFKSAARKVKGDDTGGAKEDLHLILETPSLESRVYLQAWHALRELREEPPAETTREVKGMVIDVGLEMGLDTLAAYSDGSARYINQSGKVIIWDSSDPEIGRRIEELLEVAAEIVKHTGPHTGERYAPPSEGGVLLSILTFGGVHVGGGDLVPMSADALGGPALQRGAMLMAALIDMVEQDG